MKVKIHPNTFEKIENMLKESGKEAIRIKATSSC